MLMFVFGAGASFDSDPARRPGDPELLDSDVEYRPPLAAGLFDPSSRHGKDVVAAFPRAASLLMQLRQATARGLDVEEVLEQVKLAENTYPETATQLLALRAYLARLLAEVPADWAEECQGLTNYVLALAQADTWNVSVHGETPSDPVGSITFNYDSLIEDAVERVFGHRVDAMEKYASHPRIHVYKLGQPRDRNNVQGPAPRLRGGRGFSGQVLTPSGAPSPRGWTRPGALSLRLPTSWATLTPTSPLATWGVRLSRPEQQT